MRNKGLDFFRLVASFSVISLHVGNYPGFCSEEIGAAIRLSGRWAVPFFFMLSGYFLSGKNDSYRFVKPLCKCTLLFVISTIALVPLLFIKQGYWGGISQLFSSEVLLRGSYFHLWYLSSFVTGLLLLLTCECIGLKKAIPILSILSLILYLAMGSYNPISTSGVKISRHFSSIGFIYIGALMKYKEPSRKSGVILCVLGFVLQELRFIC